MKKRADRLRIVMDELKDREAFQARLKEEELKLRREEQAESERLANLEQQLIKELKNKLFAQLLSWLIATPVLKISAAELLRNIGILSVSDVKCMVGDFSIQNSLKGSLKSPVLTKS